MKKRGVTFIETVIAITIFLIGIIPIAQLTLNSLRNLKRASEIEEGARVATTVINYIKSQGYDSILESGGFLDQTIPTNLASKTYTLEISDDMSSYILDTSNGKPDFELDFFKQASTATVDDVSSAIFIINSLGISSEAITVIVNLATSDLKVADSSFSTDTSYTNPISDTSGSGVIIGSGGIIEDPIIYGNVFIEYETLSNSLNEVKDYDQNFVITPLENFKE